MSDRGMKKWAPYKALYEQASSLQAEREAKEIPVKPEITEDEAEEINRILVNYKGQPVRVKYYRNQKIFDEIIVIKRIDTYEKKLVLADRQSIKLSEIFYLKNID